jgi:hypothetical protein
MINLTDLKHHIAARDSQGRPVLIREPVSAEFATASPGSRLVYRRAVAAEESQVVEASHYVNMPARPPGYDQMPDNPLGLVVGGGKSPVRK